jgi:hypothetical protein
MPVAVTVAKIVSNRLEDLIGLIPFDRQAPRKCGTFPAQPRCPLEILGFAVGRAALEKISISAKESPSHFEGDQRFGLRFHPAVSQAKAGAFSDRMAPHRFM